MTTNEGYNILNVMLVTGGVWTASYTINCLDKALQAEVSLEDAYVMASGCLDAPMLRPAGSTSAPFGRPIPTATRVE